MILSRDKWGGLCEIDYSPGRHASSLGHSLAER